MLSGEAGRPGDRSLLVALVAVLDQELALKFWPLLPANQRPEFRKGEKHHSPALDSPTIRLPNAIVQHRGAND